MFWLCVQIKACSFNNAHFSDSSTVSIFFGKFSDKWARSQINTVAASSGDWLLNTFRVKLSLTQCNAIVVDISSIQLGNQNVDKIISLLLRSILLCFLPLDLEEKKVVTIFFEHWRFDFVHKTSIKLLKYVRKLFIIKMIEM